MRCTCECMCERAYLFRIRTGTGWGSSPFGVCISLELIRGGRDDKARWTWGWDAEDTKLGDKELPVLQVVRGGWWVSLVSLDAGAEPPWSGGVSASRRTGPTK